ncbi:hypothetical protein FRB91_000368 [Serendipita sp. 411]|nr:hypothetical protein FRB91_000368 [Serendipita sp. 411]
MLGIKFKINHDDGHPCPRPHSLGPLTIVHVNGFHDAEVLFWSTFACCTSKENAWTTKDRLREFQRTARQWNYLVALRESTCGINIPDNWQDTVDPNDRWLFRQFVHFDANFRLVLEARSQRTGSNHGLWGDNGFFVGNQQYLDYLQTVDLAQQNKSTCSDLRALLNNNRSRFQRLDITGVAGAVCRHDCAIPGSFVNLYKGERFVNSDYALSNTFKTSGGLTEIVVSYDIACQYSTHFEGRFRNSRFLLLPESNIIFLIPKFHLPSHKEACQFRFSFNHVKGVGRSDGEGIERLWSTHNHLSSSTSKMTPAFRQDTLNLHFMDWNMSKSRRMGSTLYSRLMRAYKQLSTVQLEFKELCETLDPNRVESWVTLEETFDVRVGTGSANIFQAASSKAPTRAAILASITRLESNSLQREDLSLEDWDPVAVTWVNEGLEIEEMQQRIVSKRSKINSGSMQIETDLLERDRRELWDRFLQWRSESLTTQATGGDITIDTEDDDPTRPEDEHVVLPSSFPRLEHPLRLSQIEQRLREGQANEALETIRICLSHRVALSRIKGKEIRGQNANLRADSVLRRLNEQLNHAVRQYRRAYNAMLSLGMPPQNPTYRTLEDSHLKTSSVFNTHRLPGRGHEGGPSWIWQNTDAVRTLDDNWLDEVERAQFLDAKVNRDRWAEEVELLQTELIRTKASFLHFSNLWHQLSLAPLSSPGRSAFCSRMAARYTGMAWDVQGYIDKSEAIPRPIL